MIIQFSMEFVLVFFKACFVGILFATNGTINYGTIIFLVNFCKVSLEVPLVRKFSLTRGAWDKMRSIAMCTRFVVSQRCSICESFWALVTLEFLHFKVHPACMLKSFWTLVTSMGALFFAFLVIVTAWYDLITHQTHFLLVLLMTVIQTYNLQANRALVCFMAFCMLCNQCRQVPDILQTDFTLFHIMLL